MRLSARGEFPLGGEQAVQGAGGPGRDSGPRHTIHEDGGATYTSLDPERVRVERVADGWLLSIDDSWNLLEYNDLVIHLSEAADFPCPSVGDDVPVLLKKVDVPVAAPRKPYSIQYGNLRLRFTSETPDGVSICRVETRRGGAPGQPRLQAGPGHLSPACGDSVADATVDLFPPGSPSTAAVACDFSELRALARAGRLATIAALDKANHCRLGGGAASPSIVAR